MSQSIHFAVYLLNGVERQLSPPVVLLLRRMAASRRGRSRRVVFVAAEFALPATLEGSIQHLDAAPERSERPMRLRDGRWVV
jgi:hypothetical protein